MYDAPGGIYFVNKDLMKMFKECKYETYLISVRLSGYYQEIEYPDYIENIIINPDEEWGTVRVSKILAELKKFHVLEVFKLIYQRIAYNKKIRKDYSALKEKIREIKPDRIINSHYELLDAIPEEYLNKTIMHFHTNFKIVKDNWSYRKIFDKYKDKLYKFVWLTEATKKEAIKNGYNNSMHIYNAVRVKSNKTSDVEKNKSLVFLGRISKEKRLDIILQLFDEISSEYPDWKLSIYGMGTLNEEEKRIINTNKQITYYGATNDLEKVFMNSSININTSDFEGFSMTVLEANEYGVPTITFRFGESVYEEIIDDETGIIVKTRNIDDYRNKLREIMDNSKKLRELSKNCKKFNKNFSYSIIKQEWIKLLNGD